MKSLRSFSARVMSYARVAVTLIVSTLVLSAIGYGQQQQPPRKKAPTLTTDDVVKPRVETTVEEPAAAEAGDTKVAVDAKPQPAEAKVNPDEAAWRTNVKQAREHAKETERAAEEAELRVTELRNQLGHSGQTPQRRNEIAADLDEAGRHVTELRADARRAKADLEKLVEYGRQKGYAEEAQSGESKDKPGASEYRARYDRLQEQLRDADRKVQLYENRVRELNQRIQNNTGTGDNFYIGQLQQERNEAQQQMQEAAAARDKAREDIENLLDEARRAGIPPGTFR